MVTRLPMNRSHSDVDGIEILESDPGPVLPGKTLMYTYFGFFLGLMNSAMASQFLSPHVGLSRGSSSRGVTNLGESTLAGTVFIICFIISLPRSRQ